MFEFHNYPTHRGKLDCQLCVWISEYPTHRGKFLATQTVTQWTENSKVWPPWGHQSHTPWQALLSLASIYYWPSRQSIWRGAFPSVFTNTTEVKVVHYLSIAYNFRWWEFIFDVWKYKLVLYLKMLDSISLFTVILWGPPKWDSSPKSFTQI